jgi:hypothetical protein
MTAPNPLKGEVRFEVEDGRAFLAVFDINAICAMEDLRDRPAVQIIVQVAQGRIGFIIDALWAALRAHHPKLTRDEVGALLPNIKGAKAADLVLNGLKAAFPAPAEDEPGEASGKPSPQAAPGADGIGAPS